MHETKEEEEGGKTLFVGTNALSTKLGIYWRWFFVCVLNTRPSTWVLAGHSLVLKNVWIQGDDVSVTVWKRLIWMYKFLCLIWVRLYCMNIWLECGFNPICFVDNCRRLIKIFPGSFSQNHINNDFLMYLDSRIQCAITWILTSIKLSIFFRKVFKFFNCCRHNCYPVCKGSNLPPMYVERNVCKNFCGKI